MFFITFAKNSQKLNKSCNVVRMKYENSQFKKANSVYYVNFEYNKDRKIKNIIIFILFYTSRMLTYLSIRIKYIGHGYLYKIAMLFSKSDSKFLQVCGRTGIFRNNPSPLPPLSLSFFLHTIQYFINQKFIHWASRLSVRTDYEAREMIQKLCTQQPLFLSPIIREITKLEVLNPCV